MYGTGTECMVRGQKLQSVDRHLSSFLGMLITGVLLSSASAQGVKPASASASLPVRRVLKLSTPALDVKAVRPNHQLFSTYERAQQIHAYIRQNVDDYTCLLVKRERVAGELLPHEHIYVKFRSERVSNEEVVVPFSVYMRFLGPKRMRGREVLYVAGENDGDMLARHVGRRASIDLSVDPHGVLAMRDNRYPITEFGIENLLSRLIEVAVESMQFDDCDVNVYREAKVDGRICTGYEVKHPTRSPGFRFHLARVFVDDELGVPIRYAAYDWPVEPGGEPLLLEEYTYRRLKLNVGLTNGDFQRANPDYGFRKDA